MIAADRANEYLKTKKVEDKDEVALKAIQKLSGKPKELGLLLLDEHPDLLNKQWSWSERNTKQTQLIKECIQTEEQYFHSKEYQELFEILTGNAAIAAMVPSALKRLEGMMYQNTYSRRSFRAPNTPALSLDRKVAFLERLNDFFCFEITLKEYIQYLNYGEMPWSQYLHLFIANAIDNGDEGIYKICKDIIFGEDEIGSVSQQLIKGLLSTEKPEAWNIVEKLLLAAQRQEGLRQTVLESLDETSIGAMIHFLKVIQEHNLMRFSSVVRAMDVWAGFGWDAPRQGTIKKCIQLAIEYLEDEKAAESAFKSKDNLELYMALWATATKDVEPAIAQVEKLLQTKSSTSNQKCTALYFLYETEIRTARHKLSYPMLKDGDVKVQAQALINIDSVPKTDYPEMISVLEGILDQWPAKAKVHSSYIFEWHTINIDRERVYAALIRAIYGKGFDKWSIEQHFNNFSAQQRDTYTRTVLPAFNRWEKPKEETIVLDAKQRDFALSVLKDRSSSVRETALQALIRSKKVEMGEAQQFEQLLTRTTANVRRSAIKLLMGQSIAELQASVQRLMLSKNQMQRLAALDIALQLKESKKLNTNISKIIIDFKEKGKITPKEKLVLDNILNEEEQYTWENGLALFNPNNIEKAQLIPTPNADSDFVKIMDLGYQGLSMPSEEAIAQLESLNQLIDDNKTYEYEIKYYDGTKRTVLIGNNFRRAQPYEKDKKETAMERLQAMPLAETWIKWFEETKLTAIDLKCILSTYSWQVKNYKCIATWHQELRKKCFPNLHFYDDYETKHYAYVETMKSIMELLYNAFPPAINMHKYGADATAYYYNHIPASSYKESYEDNCYACPDSWREDGNINYWLGEYSVANESWEDEDLMAYFQLRNWRFTNSTNEYYKSDSSFYFELYKRKLIPIDAIYELVLKDGNVIGTLTHKHDSQKILEKYPFLVAIVDACRDRILEIELQRGDTPTLVTNQINNLNQIFGVDNVVRILQAFGKDNFHRGYIYSWRQEGLSKKQSLSKLLRVAQPLPNETVEDFSKKMNAAKISEKRLIELAMYAPQWLRWVALHLQWKGLEMATWWLHAHTNEYHDKRKESEISKYSAIKMETFRDGAVDVDWFKEAYKTIGKKRWEILYAAAKYISDGTGHRRAQLYADAITGKLKMREVKSRIKDKRNKDYVRLFGLMKLSSRDPQKDLLTRYEMLQKFLKESKQFGAQRQTSEKLAVTIAMDNLSRTAGFSDPIRLTWAMEAKAAAAIFEEGTVVEEGEYRVELRVDEQGKSSILSSKGGNPLKSIPAKFKKNKAVLRLKAHHKKLKDQYSRSRKALEEAMVRGDEFIQTEIADLMAHPVIAPMLKKLLFVAEGDKLGFWDLGHLQDKNNDTLTLEADSKIRIAHCTDLQRIGDWADFQRIVFEQEIVQPFKQIFRELYTPTPDELKLKACSERYAGYQVQPKKALALLKSRGWVVDYQSGLQKVFHKQGFIAKVYSMIDWYTPADVENPTLESIEFHFRDSFKNVPFDEIEPRIFSEIMRDLDLVVSVAHAGGVDPEASLSTIELRKVLLEESMRLFKIDNVSTKGNHAFVKGALSDYSVHLGSAIIHRQPGGYVAVVPVHSQHRGRIFLPFADEDPKSAELISKVLLLAKDKEIKDPTILRQLG